MKVSTRVLIFTAGLVWIASGSMLVSLTFKWFASVEFLTLSFLLLAGVMLGFAKAKLVFIRYSDKNIERIMSYGSVKKCLCAFLPLSSYIMIFGMSFGGSMLRKSGIVPKEVLLPLYFGIGMALILSSFRYFLYLYRNPIKKI